MFHTVYTYRYGFAFFKCTTRQLTRNARAARWTTEGGDAVRWFGFVRVFVVVTGDDDGSNEPTREGCTRGV